MEGSRLPEKAVVVRVSLSFFLAGKTFKGRWKSFAEWTEFALTQQQEETVGEQGGPSVCRWLTVFHRALSVAGVKKKTVSASSWGDLTVYRSKG